MKDINKRLEQLETQALDLFEGIAALRRELSGGSEGSLNSKLSKAQKKEITKNRRKRIDGNIN